jgi:DNA-binding transcriptional MerR regulator
VEPGLPISAAAREVGVDAGTLRAWQRRYGLGASVRSPGGHRRYIAVDLDQIRAVRDLVAAGISTADAARAVLSGELPGHGLAEAAARLGISDGLDDVAAELDRLCRAALDLDGPSATAVLQASMTRRGSCQTWESLMAPALRRIDSCDASRPQRVISEHLISHLVAGALIQQLSRRPVVSAPRRVLLACAPNEQHTLPLLALAATLAETGIGASMFGARTPRSALRHAISADDQLIIVVLAVQAVDAGGLVGDPRRPGLTWIAAGPGWTHDQLPESVAYVNELSTAVHLIRTALDD